MSLTMANAASETPMTSMPSVQTSTTAPTAVAAPVAGDNNNSQAVPASATVMIVIGVVLGVIGVATVITLIWWMRRRHLARYRANGTPRPHNFHYPPAPPPKSGSMSNTSKALPHINVASANAYQPGVPTRPGRSATNGSIDKDKALPIKPVESVWSSPTERQHKSPALSRVHELRTQTTPKYDEEMAMGRMRSDSIGEGKEAMAPANFI